MPEPRPDSARVLASLSPTDPTRQISEAVEWCAQEGIPVVADAAPRVRCTSTKAPLWVPDGDAVGVLGACILRYQPQTADLDRACWMAVGMTARWAEAFAVGLSGFRRPASWEHHVAARLMTHGYLLGLEIRTRAQEAVCARHDKPYHREEGCAECAAEDAATPYDPDFGRWGQ